MTVYQLYKAFTATLADGAHIDIRRAGRIKQLCISAGCDLDADGEFATAEVSMAAAPQLDVNDARDVLGILFMSSKGPTDAALIRGDKDVLIPLDIAVQAGDRIYLHAELQGTASFAVTVHLHVAD